MLKTLPWMPLAQALVVGVVIGTAWSLHAAWPQTPALIPGALTVPQPGSDAVPLPRFPASFVALAARARDPQEPRPPRAESPARPRHGEPPARREPQPRSQREPAAGDAEPGAGDAQPAAAGAPPSDLDAALASFEAGFALYRDFVAGVGDRAEVAPRARKQIEQARAELEAARRRHPGEAHAIDQRIEACDSYMGFLVHYGG